MSNAVRYAPLDNAILRALENTSVPMPFRELLVHPEINKIALQAVEKTTSDAFRLLDARLASLRKAGRIQPAPKRAGWELVGMKAGA